MFVTQIFSGTPKIQFKLFMDRIFYIIKSETTTSSKNTNKLSQK